MDLTGQRFHHLTVIGPYWEGGWICECDCGTKDIVIPTHKLLNQKTCGWCEGGHKSQSRYMSWVTRKPRHGKKTR